MNKTYSGCLMTNHKIVSLFHEVDITLTVDKERNTIFREVEQYEDGQFPVSVGVSFIIVNLTYP